MRHDDSQQFASDNYAGICPEAWDAMQAANAGHAPAYGADSWTQAAADGFRQLFEIDCEVFFVFNGTAANSLAVDPATEVRIQSALERLLEGRTSVAIAHRLSTAEAADVVVVVDDGRIVETGHHRDLVGAGGRYSALHASWAAQQEH